MVSSPCSSSFKCQKRWIARSFPSLWSHDWQQRGDIFRNHEGVVTSMQRKKLLCTRSSLENEPTCEKTTEQRMRFDDPIISKCKRQEEVLPVLKGIKHHVSSPRATQPSLRHAVPYPATSHERWATNNYADATGTGLSRPWRPPSLTALSKAQGTHDASEEYVVVVDGTEKHLSGTLQNVRLATAANLLGNGGDLRVVLEQA